MDLWGEEWHFVFNRFRAISSIKSCLSLVRHHFIQKGGKTTYVQIKESLITIT